MKTDISYNLISAAIDSTRDGVIISDAENRIIYVNRAFTGVTGYSPEEAIGQSPSILRSGLHDEPFYKEMWQELISVGRWQGNIWNRRKNGEIYLEHITIITDCDQDGNINHYIGVFSDIRDLRETKDRLQRITSFDSLTELPNRAQVYLQLKQISADVARDKDLVAVVLLDLDDFKSLNDHFGHALGDQLLTIIAQRLKKFARSNDLVGRLGGDEFILIMRDLHNIDEVKQMTTRILNVVSSPCVINGNQHQITASMGVTILPFDNADSDTLLRHADQAMYIAKEQGRNRYHLFDTEKDQRIQTRRQLLNRLAVGLAHDELVLYYQPKVNLRTGEIVGVEALLRWLHPDDGMLLPGDFLPHAEHSDLIIGIGEWVIQQAISQVLAWNKSGLNISVSVNIAARQLLRHDFVEVLQEILQEQPSLPRGSLEIEILESAALEDTKHVQKVIEECQKHGIKFSLDDFGTGFASLSYLRDIPADILKIDRSFVSNILDNTDDMTLVEGIIGLGTAFQRVVVAEGVETAEQGVLLMRLGCDFAQGYGIARPMPADEIPDWVESFRPDPQWALWADTHWEMSDFPLLVAQYDHIKWVRRVLLHVDGASLQLSPAELSDHRLCRFGHWYYGHGLSRYSHVKKFAELEQVHTAVHQVGKEIVALCSLGKKTEAKQKSKELLDLKDQIIEKLTALQLCVANHTENI